jgi:hypothetical protein
LRHRIAGDDGDWTMRSRSVYLPKNSTIYMADYSVNGQRVGLSTGCRNEREAIAWLGARQAEIATGNYAGQNVVKVMISELIQDILDQHRIDGKKAIADEERLVNFERRRETFVEEQGGREALGCYNPIHPASIFPLGRVAQLAEQLTLNQ